MEWAEDINGKKNYEQCFWDSGYKEYYRFTRGMTYDLGHTYQVTVQYWTDQKARPDDCLEGTVFMTPEDWICMDEAVIREYTDGFSLFIHNEIIFQFIMELGTIDWETKTINAPFKILQRKNK